MFLYFCGIQKHNKSNTKINKKQHKNTTVIESRKIDTTELDEKYKKLDAFCTLSEAIVTGGPFLKMRERLNAYQNEIAHAPVQEYLELFISEAEEAMNKGIKELDARIKQYNALQMISKGY